MGSRLMIDPTSDPQYLPFPTGFYLCWLTAIAWATGFCIVFDGYVYRSYYFWDMIHAMKQLNEKEIRLTPWRARQVREFFKYCEEQSTDEECS